MSLDDPPIVWTACGGAASLSQTRARSTNSAGFAQSSPIEFRLNLLGTGLGTGNTSSSMESGLRFSNATATRGHGGYLGGNSHIQKPLMENGVEGGMGLGLRVLGRLMLASQVMILLTLTILIFGLFFVAWRLNYNVNYYYAAATPYLSELSNHGMGIMRHIDASTASLEEVMAQTQILAGTSIPEIMESVNKTSAMVARLQEVAQNPVIKLSMG